MPTRMNAGASITDLHAEFAGKNQMDGYMNAVLVVSPIASAYRIEAARCSEYRRTRTGRCSYYNQEYQLFPPDRLCHVP